MRTLTIVVLVLAMLVPACGGSGGGSPASPTPTPTPTPPPVTVTAVTVTGPGCTPGVQSGQGLCSTTVPTAIGSTLQLTATAAMSDGSASNVTEQATWNSSKTTVATVTRGLVTFRAPGECDITAAYQGKLGGNTIRVDPPIWAKTGTGDTVFDMPTYLSRVKITGDYTKNSSNFIVYVAGRLIVNELLGTGWGATHFEGTYLMSGGIVEVKLSSGVAWSFAEVRQ